MGFPGTAGVVGPAAEIIRRDYSFLLSFLALSKIMPVMAEKNPNAVALGSLGGKARAASLSDAERSAIASQAGKARSKKLTASQRSDIARLAVAARERKRKQAQKEQGKGKR